MKNHMPLCYLIPLVLSVLILNVEKCFCQIDNTISIKEPNRYSSTYHSDNPPSVEEISANITHYLHMLHHRLGALAGPTVDAQVVWETYLEVTKQTVMYWDDVNKHRRFKTRNDDSIFVGLGSYRDPFCLMTIKSLYSQAKQPENIYVGLFQQNCFEKTCRTGVLKGGIVEDAPTDDDCYKLFCNSTEGINSKACERGQVRLFNVNESESLGPYMARYLGAKFYRGENYYLQIDSHSEFVQDWDYKIVKMIKAIPAKKVMKINYC